MTLDTEEKYYVYKLIDPRDNKPFYVGKGCGARMSDHLRTNGYFIGTPVKLRIREILSDSLYYEASIIKDSLTEEQALDLEEALIAKYGRIGKNVNGILTNTQARGKRTKSSATRRDYCTVQIRRYLKDQVNDYCNQYGMKITNLIENLFLLHVSGSASGVSLPPGNITK